MAKNEKCLRIGTTHFIINNDDSKKDLKSEQIIICVKSMGTIFRACFEVRRFDDLGLLRRIRSEFSPFCIHMDGQSIHCLGNQELNTIEWFQCDLKKITENNNERYVSAEQNCQVSKQLNCFDGIHAE